MNHVHQREYSGDDFSWRNSNFENIEMERTDQSFWFGRCVNLLLLKENYDIENNLLVKTNISPPYEMFSSMV